MKYNIYINQRALVDNGLLGRLDVYDLTLFDFIFDFFNCDFDDKITFDKGGEHYAVITAKLINQQMPVLGNMSKRTFINRMNKLIDAGLIERYEGNQKEGQSGYRKGKRFSAFVFGDKVAEGTQQNAQGCEKDCVRPMKSFADNNIHNKDNNHKDNNIYKREQNFYNEVSRFSDKYPSDMLIAFFDYWTEPNPSKTKMRFEMQKTWDTGRRLARWNSNNFNTRYNGQAINSVSNDKQQRMQSYAETLAGMLQQVERNRADGKFGQRTDNEDLCW